MVAPAGCLSSGSHHHWGSGACPASAPTRSNRSPSARRTCCFLYTDGVQEARDAKGDFNPLAARAVAWTAEHPERVLRLLHDDLVTHTEGRLGDDAAAVVIRRRDPWRHRFACRTGRARGTDGGVRAAADAPAARDADPDGRRKTRKEGTMSVMDKLKRMLKGHEEQAGRAADKASGHIDETTRGRSGGQVDKGPDALREQMRPPQERDNPPQP
jgi:hypothetical protein